MKKTIRVSIPTEVIARLSEYDSDPIAAIKILLREATLNQQFFTLLGNLPNSGSTNQNLAENGTNSQNLANDGNSDGFDWQTPGEELNL